MRGLPAPAGMASCSPSAALTATQSGSDSILRVPAGCRELRDLQAAVAEEAHVPGSRLYAAAQAQAAGLQGELARASAQVADLLRAREAAFARESALQLQVCFTCLCRGHGVML